MIYEYEVINTQSSRELQYKLNDMAGDGWRMVSNTFGQVKTLGGSLCPAPNFVVVMEREARR